MTALEKFVYMLDWHYVDYVLIELDQGTTIVALGRVYVFSKDGNALAMNVESVS